MAVLSHWEKDLQLKFFDQSHLDCLSKTTNSIELPNQASNQKQVSGLLKLFQEVAVYTRKL